MDQSPRKDDKGDGSPKQSCAPREAPNLHETTHLDTTATAVAPYIHGPRLEAQKPLGRRDPEDSFGAYVVFYTFLSMVLLFGLGVREHAALYNKAPLAPVQKLNDTGHEILPECQAVYAPPCVRFESRDNDGRPWVPVLELDGLGTTLGAVQGSVGRAYRGDEILDLQILGDALQTG